jgi:putative DNA primase/helicase
MYGDFYRTLASNSQAVNGSDLNPPNRDFGHDAGLIYNGYEPIPVNGKAPVTSGWQSGEITPERIYGERAAYPHAMNTGLRTGRLVGLDIDIFAPDHAVRMRELAFAVLGETPLVRYGAKGMMLCYRNETPSHKLTVSCAGAAANATQEEKRRAKPKVEILGVGQQLVAYGTHPDTGKPYEWRNASAEAAAPLLVPLAHLPVVSREQLIAFAEKASLLLTDLGYGAGWVSMSGEEKPADATASSAGTGKRVSWKGLRERLSYIHPGFDGARPTCYLPPSQKRRETPLDYTANAWLGIGLALRDANIPLLGDEPHDWLDLADEWSCGALWHERTGEHPSDLNYPEGGVRVRLAGRKRQAGKSTTIASVIAYAMDAGCPLPPDDETTAIAQDGSGDAACGAGAGSAEQKCVLQLDQKTPYVSAAHFLKLQYSDADGTRRLIHYRDDFYAWVGTHYRALPDQQLRAEIYSFLHNAFEGRKPFAPKLTKVNDVLSALKAQVFLSPQIEAPSWLPGASGEFCASLWGDGGDILPCSNGLLHLPTLYLPPHSPYLLAFNALDFAFDREAPEPAEWFGFLNSLWPDDTEAIETLQEIFGYFLTGDLRHQKLFLLVGPKRAGKGTIARVLRMLLGAANVSGPTLASLGQPFGLEPLIGKRAAIVADARLGGGADQNAIVERLLSISGEDAIQVPRKFKSAWEGKLGVRFLILSNELPRFTDASGAIASRFLILTLKNSFYGQEDQGLTDRLIGELPAILNWAITGWQRLSARGHFVTPRSSLASADALEELSSPIAAFLKELCVIDPARRVSREDLFRAWETWCHCNGHQPGSNQSFGVRLRAAVPGLGDVRPRVGEKPVRMYTGISTRS